MPLSAAQVRILDATIACVSYRGFTATTKEIGLLADMCQGTLYTHYASKQLILGAAYEYAATRLFRPGQDLPGDTLYEQLQSLWFRTATQALAHRDAFTYWSLYRQTPGYANWSFPAGLQMDAFYIVGIMVHRRTGARGEHALQSDSLAAWQWTAQWVAALQVALPLWLQADTAAGWPTEPSPTIAQVLRHAFEAAWRSLGLPRHTPAEPSAYG
jgi:AcrR family transcriptional regulator